MSSHAIYSAVIGWGNNNMSLSHCYSSITAQIFLLISSSTSVYYIHDDIRGLQAQGMDQGGWLLCQGSDSKMCPEAHLPQEHHVFQSNIILKQSMNMANTAGRKYLLLQWLGWVRRGAVASQLILVEPVASSSLTIHFFVHSEWSALFTFKCVVVVSLVGR